jgi:hypothetical protein
MEEEDDECPIPCFKCGGRLKNVYGPNQPMEGLEFTTRGHYGSTAFDPMDNTGLVINICDVCLKEGSKDGTVLQFTLEEQVVVPVYKKWGAR